MLWRLQLGHPNFRYLKFLFSKLFQNKDLSLFKCEFAKYHRLHFSLQS